RHAELAHDPHHDPALRGAVELRETETGEPYGLMEHGGLRKADLSGRRIEDHQRLVRRARELTLGHALELDELVHEVRLRVQASGRIDDEDVDVTRGRRLDRVEDDGRR